MASKHFSGQPTSEGDSHRITVNFHEDKNLFFIGATTKVPTEEEDDDNFEFIDLWLTEDQFLFLREQIDNALEFKRKREPSE